jgi:two-component system, LytTR family, sensor kinase
MRAWLATKRTQSEGGRDATAAVLFAVAILLLFGLLRFGYFYFGDVAVGHAPRVAPYMVNELTGALGSIVAFLLLIPFVRRFPLRDGPRAVLGRLPLYAVALLAVSALMTTTMWITRSGLYPLLGLGDYDYGILAVRYPMEGFNHVALFIMMVGAIQFWQLMQEARERAVRNARLEAQLAEARLASLEAQLQPHFLFNTLNTVSSVMYRNPVQADRVLSRLSELLRTQLDGSGGEIVSVEEDVRALRAYLEIMEARFSDRLSWNVRIDEEARAAALPRFILQPLVENAIKHGISPSADAGLIQVSIGRTGDRLRAQVEDDGPGPRGQTDGAGGFGLANVRQRLEYLYGASGTLTLQAREPRGALAVVELPFSLAADAATTRGA